MNHELRYCASRSVHRIDTEFLYQGLHELPDRLNRSLKEAINSVETDKYDYILVNYGLCGNGTLDITHPKLPIIVHSFHDCIPLLIGDRKFHADYVKERPGTFWFSIGWIEGFPLPGSPDFAEKYSEFYNRMINEKQRDVIEQMLMQNYTHLTFIRWDELGRKVAELGRDYTKRCVRSLSSRLGHEMIYDEVKGSPGILRRFVDGEWAGGDFLCIEPGKRLKFDPLKNLLYVE
ncbi:hypothetical protein LCGC14_2241990 [marine sediment metagenome]|uniref:DUF1638 domain-containing protein n=1 Tax=marine sediment metagenome TaxID=412755 RepID=A0A0F9D5D4_9ZZZZ